MIALLKIERLKIKINPLKSKTKVIKNFEFGQNYKHIKIAFCYDIFKIL